METMQRDAKRFMSTDKRGTAGSRVSERLENQVKLRTHDWSPEGGRIGGIVRSEISSNLNRLYHPRSANARKGDEIVRTGLLERLPTMKNVTGDTMSPLALRYTACSDCAAPEIELQPSCQI